MPLYQADKVVNLAASNTTYTSGTVVLSGGANVTVGTNGQTVTISAAGGGAGIGGIAVNAATTYTSGTVVLSAGANITLGTNAQTVTISGVAAQTNQSVGLYALGNTTQNSSTTLDARTLSFNGLGGITVGYSNGSIQLSGATGGGGGGLTLSYFNPQDAYVQVTGQQGNGTLHFQPMQAPDVTFDRVILPVVLSLTTNTCNLTLTFRVGFYTRNGSSISLLSSTSTAMLETISTGNTTLYNGLRLLSIPMTYGLAASQYWVGIVSSSATAAANMSISQIVASQQNSTVSGPWGVSTNSSFQYTRGLGRYSAATNGLPNGVAFSQIYGMSSMVLRQPVFYLVSDTV